MRHTRCAGAFSFVGKRLSQISANIPTGVPRASWRRTLQDAPTSVLYAYRPMCTGLQSIDRLNKYIKFHKELIKKRAFSARMHWTDPTRPPNCPAMKRLCEAPFRLKIQFSPSVHRVSNSLEIRELSPFAYLDLTVIYTVQ